MSRLSGWLHSAAARAEGAVGLAVPAPARDWALWRAAGAGDAASATRLVRQLTPQAYGLAIQLVRRREDAQDAVQDAFLRLWRSQPSDTRGARLSTYFNTIVINCCRSLLAARREQPTEHDALTDLHDAQQLRDRATGGGGHHPAGAGDGDDEAGLQAGISTRLHRALRRLPVRQRMAIAMWAYADASVPDIARTLEIDPNAAHQLLHRAKLALRTHFEVEPG